MASTLANQTGTLLHKQLFLALQQQVMRGAMADGARLPTQEELCTQYGVSRITVRRALADLQSAGLVRNEQGVGSFVIAPKRGISSPPTLSFVEGLRKVVEETEVRVMRLESAVCPASVGTALGLEPGGQGLHVLRLRLRKGVPVMLLEVWLPLRFESVVTRAALREQPLFNLLTRGGKDVGKVIQEVSAEIADAATADALQIELNSAVLRIDRLVHDRRQQPIQFLTSRSTPLRSRLLMEIGGADVNTLSAGHLIHDRI